MTDRKKPQTIADGDLEGAQGGLYTTSAAGTELYSTSAAGTELFTTSSAGTELMTTDASTMEAKRKLKQDGDGFIAYGNAEGTG